MHRIEDRTLAPTAYQGPPFAAALFETSEISLIGILALLPALVAMWLLARWLWCEMPGFYRRPKNRCDDCDYDLRGCHSPVCPECGEPVA